LTEIHGTVNPIQPSTDIHKSITHRVGKILSMAIQRESVNLIVQELQTLAKRLL
jgi:hypothetical protein